MLLWKCEIQCYTVSAYTFPRLDPCTLYVPRDSLLRGEVCHTLAFHIYVLFGLCAEVDECPLAFDFVPLTQQIRSLIIAPCTVYGSGSAFLPPPPPSAVHIRGSCARANRGARHLTLTAQPSLHSAETPVRSKALKCTITARLKSDLTQASVHAESHRRAKTATAEKGAAMVYSRRG